MIWDPCLARAVAAEVQARLGGKRTTAVEFLRERRTVRVHFREATLAAELAPGRGAVVLRPPSDPDPNAERLPATLAATWAVADERIIVLRFRRVRGKKANPSLILEFAANRWNACWAEGAQLVVRKRLRPGTGAGRTKDSRTKGGPRGTATSAPGIGTPWEPPGGRRRKGADGRLEMDEWLAAWPAGPEAAEAVGTSEGGAEWMGSRAGVGGRADRAGASTARGAEDRTGRLRGSVGGASTARGAETMESAAVRRWISQVAYVSPINAPWLLSADGPVAAFRRWRLLAEGTETAPCLLRLPSGLQPYPWPLGASLEGTPAGGGRAGGTPLGGGCEAGAKVGSALRATPVESLLHGMDAVLAAADAESGSPLGAIDGRDTETRALDRESRRLERKLGALRGQLDRTGQANRLREEAALILASLGQIGRGSERVVLTGFDGKARTLELDPALRPHENADARFRLAARMERGAAKLARRIRRTEAALDQVAAAMRLHRRGELAREELEAVLPASPKRKGPRAHDAPALPYRRYRSSGGLEVRVGRGAGRNDDLTFRHSRPNDVWLHARHAAGAHVVLRWTRAERPPATDLEEAATLAANHSGARGARHVPVDWTRRKWVRKPRGAPPGVVALERVETVFVSPDPALEERLRVGTG